MGTKNTVTAGEYKGGRIELKIKIRGNNEVVLVKPGFFAGKFPIDNEHVESYEVVESESRTSATSAVTRGMLGAALLGPIGIAAALSAKKKSLHTMVLQFKDGKSSMIDVDNEIYKTITQNLFKWDTPQLTPVEQVVTPKQPDAAAEIEKFKALLDNGAITQEEYDTKKKQLLGV